MKHSNGFAIAAVVGMLGAAVPFVSAQAATAQEQANIKVVEGFYAALDERDAAGGESKRPIRPIAEKYLAVDYKQMGQANGSEPGGRERLITQFSTPRAGGPPPGAAGQGGAPGARAGGMTMEPAKMLFISAVGDLVVRISQRGSTVGWNMFRVKDGLLVEHWDAASGPSMGR